MRFLASVRLAGWLIGILLGFLVLSFLVPQRGIYPPEQVDEFLAMLPDALGWLVATAGLDALFSSFLFYVVAALLALNLTVCTLRRMVRRRRVMGAATIGTVPAEAMVIHGLDPDAVERSMRSLSAIETRSPLGLLAYVVRRGTTGYWGSVILHAALVILAAGGVVSGLTAFRGEMVLTEGQTVADVPESYLHIDQVPRWGTQFGEFQIALERMEFEYEGDTIVDAVAHMVVSDAGASREDKGRVNYPVLVDGKSFLLYDTGHAVWVSVAGPDGASLFDSFVNMGESGPEGYSDSLDVDGLEIRLLSRPDSSRPVDEPVERGLDLREPVVGVRAGRQESVRDYVWLEPGQSTDRDGYTVTIKEVRLWNRFMVRADGGRHIVYLGFLLVIVGACMRFLDPDRQVAVVPDTFDGEPVFRMWGQQRYWSAHAPREMRRLYAEFEGQPGVRVVTGDVGDESGADTDVAGTDGAVSNRLRDGEEPR